MSDVSCRAFRYYLEAEKAGVCDVDALIAGLPYTRRWLEDERNWIGWDDWARMADRFGAGHSDADLVDFGRFAVNDSFGRYLTRAVSPLTSTSLLVTLGFKWGAAGLYRPVRWALDTSGTGRIVINGTLEPGRRPSRAWFVMAVGGTSIIPMFVGRPRLQLDYEATASSVRMVVHLTDREPLEWLRRKTRALFAPDKLLDELVEQREELRQTWDEMHRRTSSFGNVLDALPVAVAVFHAGIISYANPALAKLVGREASALGGTALDALVRAEDTHALYRLVAGEDQEATIGLARADGAEAVIEARVVRGTHFQDKTADILVGRDVTERVASARERERAEATARALAEIESDLVVRLSADLVILDVRAGRKVEESALLAGLIGASSEAFIAAVPHPDAFDIRGFIREYRESMAAGRVFEREVSVPDAAGTARVLFVVGTPILGGRESVILVRNETERRLMERRLAIAERMASMGTLAAGVAHEINNPLTYMTLNVQLLREAEGRDDPAAVAEREELMAALEVGARRIRDVVARMRALSRVDDRRPTPTRPKAAIENALAMTAHETRHRARLVIDLRDVPEVAIDPTELGQVAVNLIMNAVHAMDGAPPPATGHELGVRLLPTEGTVVFEVSDTGIGIAPEDVSRIFDPFFTTKLVESGTGLGLSIAHSIVTEAGGTIEVDSVRGKGSTLRVVLPAAPNSPPVHASRSERAANTLTGGRRVVVVVDDDPQIGRVIQRALGPHEVETFLSAELALPRLRAAPLPDLVLCDVMMPGMSGVELYEQIAREHPDVARRIVFLTGGAFTRPAEAFLARPELRVLRKPLELDELRALLDELP